MPDAREPNYDWYVGMPNDSLDWGYPADETVFFSLGEDDYAINLTKKHAAELRAALAPFIENARKVGEVSLETLREELHKDQGEIYYQPPFRRVDRPMALADSDGMWRHPGELPEGTPPDVDLLPVLRDNWWSDESE